MARIPRTSVTLALALFTLSLPGSALRAQGPDLKNSSTFGLGYVASIPDMFVGITVMGLTPALLGGAGLYADVRFTHDSPGRSAYFLDNVSPEQAEIEFGDQMFQQRSAWVSFDLAVVYVITRDFAAYGGGGYLKEEHYHEYFDDSQTRGDFGFYWVLDEEASGTRVNVLGGLLFRAGRYVLFQVGAESRPGAMVGVMFTLPL